MCVCTCVFMHVYRIYAVGCEHSETSEMCEVSPHSPTQWGGWSGSGGVGVVVRPWGPLCCVRGVWWGLPVLHSIHRWYKRLSELWRLSSELLLLLLLLPPPGSGGKIVSERVKKTRASLTPLLSGLKPPGRPERIKLLQPILTQITDVQ